MTVSPMLTTAQVAQVFNVSEATVRAWHKSGKLRGVKVGRDIRWDPKMVDDRIKAAS